LREALSPASRSTRKWVDKVDCVRPSASHNSHTHNSDPEIARRMRTRFPSAKAAAARTSGLAGIVKRIGIDRYEKPQRVKAQALSGPDFLQPSSGNSAAFSAV
jgi:hypothetical protein